MTSSYLFSVMERVKSRVACMHNVAKIKINFPSCREGKKATYRRSSDLQTILSVT